ncbi:MAG: sulfite exporter TauE/SafE family protein [Candidatus Krumholzibacteriia bacterium]
MVPPGWAGGTGLAHAADTDPAPAPAIDFHSGTDVDGAPDAAATGTVAPGSGVDGAPVAAAFGAVATDAAAGAGPAAARGDDGDDAPWWKWPLILLVTTFGMGVVAVLGGVGGGVLYVPIISGFFPFHIDFVRGAGLLVALSGALAAGPGLLKANLASLRLAIPVALIASSCAIVGAMVGLALPTKVVQITLGATILAICVLMLVAKKSVRPVVPAPDRLSAALRIYGVYYEPSAREAVDWQVHRTPLGLILFIFIGVLAGMFGLGAGWANVPVLNLLMGAPLKISVATSKFLLSITDTSAAWIYLNQGAVIPLIVVPSLVGIMLGSFVGVRVLRVVNPSMVRWIVIAILAFAGLKSLTKGLGWG